MKNETFRTRNIPIHIAVAFFFFAAAFTLPWQIQLALLALNFAAIVGIRKSLVSARRVVQFFLSLFGFGVVVLLANSLLIKEGTIVGSFAGFTMYSEGWRFGRTIFFRLALLLTTLTLFFGFVSYRSLIMFIQRQGFPPRLSFIMLLSLTYAHTIPRRIENVLLAQQARGYRIGASLAAKIRALFPVVTPLVLSALAESLDRGIALEQRGMLSARKSERDPIPLVALGVFTLGILLIAAAIAGVL